MMTGAIAISRAWQVGSVGSTLQTAIALYRSRTNLAEEVLHT
jgi:hypothetical protein